MTCWRELLRGTEVYCRRKFLNVKYMAMRRELFSVVVLSFHSSALTSTVASVKANVLSLCAAALDVASCCAGPWWCGRSC